MGPELTIMTEGGTPYFTLFLVSFYEGGQTTPSRSKVSRVLTIK